jgi:TrmH family RNA methyltransferase
MIPLDKLARLPRHQRLRKAEKILAAAERQLAAGPQLAAERGMGAGAGGAAGPGEKAGGAEGLAADCLAYLAELLALLAGDGEFSPAERRVFEEAARGFEREFGQDARRRPSPPAGVSGSRRALNAARHVLLASTGRYPADWDLIDGEALDGAARRVFPGMRVYLEDIRSPFNVGAMFRAAESFGVERLLLSPLCADPRHRRALRTAMGCVDVLPWERAELAELLGPWRREGETGGALEGPGETEPCFALETGGLDIAEFAFPPRGLLIAGSEELGVSPQALERADASLGRLSIRTWGAKGSLNVSVAFGIALQRWAEVLAGAPAGCQCQN